MKNLTKAILVVLAAGFVSTVLSTQKVEATPIYGTIDFAGSAEFDTTSLATAREVVQFNDVFGNAGYTNVAAVSGDFSGISLGTQTIMAASWQFNPSTPTPGLWTVGGFTFDLLSATIVTQTSTFLSITGSGIITGNGFDPSLGTWAFSVQSSGDLQRARFSFSGNSEVPDGGTTVMLLGTGLGALGMLGMVRRRLKI
jgi:hypothetical protein